MTPSIPLGMLIAVCVSLQVDAQQSGIPDTLAGRVLDRSRLPVAGATVRVAGERDSVWRSTVTDSAGRYSFLVPADVRRFVVSVRRLGFAPLTTTIEASPSEHRIVRDLRPDIAAQTLGGVEVRGQPLRLTGGGIPPAAGSRDQVSLLWSMEEMPIDLGNLGEIAKLTPGVIPLHPGDSATLAPSIAGQSPGQNAATLDGATYASSSLPREALAATNVTASTYDVARGQFSGGQISATTRKGGDRWVGALQFAASPSALQAGAMRTTLSPTGEEGWLDAGGGGPVGWGGTKRFTVYGAGRAFVRTSPGVMLESIDAEGLRRLGLSADSVRKFEDVVRGLGARAPSLASGRSVTKTLGTVLRADYNVSSKSILTLRLDARDARATNLGSPFGLTETQASVRRSGTGLLGQLSSRWDAVSHELRLYASRGAASTTPAFDVPGARTRIVSQDDAGVSFLYFGGNPFVASSSRGRLAEASEGIGYTSPRGRHQLKIGWFAQNEHATLSTRRDANGRFTFNSLDDLAAGRPASFTRSLGSADVSADVTNVAVYAGGQTLLREGLSASYGARAEGSWHPGILAYAPAVDALGAHPERVPAERRVSPRIGVRADLQRLLGRPLGVVNAGTGDFRGRVSLQSLALARGQIGDPAVAILSCLGPAAPVPDWTSYWTQPGATPAACAQGGGAEQFATQTPALTLFGRDFGAPATSHSSVEWIWQSPRGFRVAAAGLLVRGRREPLAFDRNLDRRERFLLGEEGRPVFADTAAIDPSTGQVPLTASRTVPALGIARELVSGGRNRTSQLTLRMSGFRLSTRGSFTADAWYAYTRSRVQSAGLAGLGGVSAATAGDPWVVAWATSDYERRHAVSSTLMWSRPHGRAQLVLIGRALSGLPFSPLVGGDVNGDGLSNDLAYVFSPGSTSDSAVRQGMTELLRGAGREERRCLRRQLATIARRNSCTGPWTSTLDAQFNWRPTGLSFGGGFMLSLAATNVLAGLDYLLHGADVRGWGQAATPDPYLLYVRGFDAARARFLYDVNRRFGTARGSRGPTLAPFALTLRGRVRLGGDPAAQGLADMVGALRGVSTQPAAMRGALIRQIANVPLALLRLNDTSSLQLVPRQIVRLQDAAALLQPRIDSVVDAMVPLLRARAGSAGRGQLEALVTRARTLVEEGSAVAQAVLSPAQWAMVPEQLRQLPTDAASLLQRTIPFSAVP